MNFCKIDGKVYDVIVTGIEESFDIQHTENAGRTVATGAPMILDPLGTFFGHTVTFQRIPGNEADYDALFDVFAKPRYDGLPVELSHNQTVLKYDAYVSTGTRVLQRITEDGKLLWGELKVKITPMEAQIKPDE